MDPVMPPQERQGTPKLYDAISARLLLITAPERSMRISSEALRRRYAQVDVIGGVSSSEIVFLSWSGNGERRITIRLPHVQRHLVFAYQWLRLLWLVTQSALAKRYQLCIATGVQAGLFGLIVRCLGITRRTIYYASDWYTQQRALQVLDRACCTLADATWDPTPKISEARQARWRRRSRRDAIWIPPLLEPRPRVLPNTTPREPAICYVGGIRPEAGLGHVVRALGLLRRSGIDVALHIVGNSIAPGYKEQIDRTIRESGVSDLIRFWGFLADDEMLSLLNRSLCGVALTPGEETNYSIYTIPRKVMDYVECGLPVILSKGSYMAGELVPRNAAVAVGDSDEEVADAVRFFIRDPQGAATYGENAYRYAQEQADPQRLFREIEKVLSIRT